MSDKITFEDLLRIFGEDFISKEIDKKVLMKHFEIGVNRIIGQRSVEKLKQVLIQAIETTRVEQSRDKGVENIPISRQSSSITIKRDSLDESIKPKKEDKYNLDSIKSGIVSKRLQKLNDPLESKLDEENKIVPEIEKHSLTIKEKDLMPSIEELTILSGGKMLRDDDEKSISNGHVQREIAIREYSIQTEDRSIRWGKSNVKNRKGELQEINYPAYIFHSDLLQIEIAREPTSERRCEILEHVILDMVANCINVVILEEEIEPFFVVEGFGLLHSKESLKDKVRIHEYIQLMIISSEAWHIALKKPEAMIIGRDTLGQKHECLIDKTSVIPLADIRTAMVGLDNDFKAHFNQPTSIIKKTLSTIQNHRKNIVWACGASAIQNLRDAVKFHRHFVENPLNTLNMVIIGTTQATHPLKIKFSPSGTYVCEELLPGYCYKHLVPNQNLLANIFNGIPSIFDSQQSGEYNISKIANAVYQRLGYSANELHFDPGYIKGNVGIMIPISNLDIILPPLDSKLQQMLIRKGFHLD